MSLNRNGLRTLVAPAPPDGPFAASPRVRPGSSSPYGVYPYDAFAVPLARIRSETSPWALRPNPNWPASPPVPLPARPGLVVHLRALEERVVGVRLRGPALLLVADRLVAGAVVLPLPRRLAGEAEVREVGRVVVRAARPRVVLRLPRDAVEGVVDVDGRVVLGAVRPERLQALEAVPRVEPLAPGRVASGARALRPAGGSRAEEVAGRRVVGRVGVVVDLLDAAVLAHLRHPAGVVEVELARLGLVARDLLLRDVALAVHGVGGDRAALVRGQAVVVVQEPLAGVVGERRRAGAVLARRVRPFEHERVADVVAVHVHAVALVGQRVLLEQVARAPRLLRVRIAVAEVGVGRALLLRPRAGVVAGAAALARDLLLRAAGREVLVREELVVGAAVVAVVALAQQPAGPVVGEVVLALVAGAELVDPLADVPVEVVVVLRRAPDLALAQLLLADLALLVEAVRVDLDLDRRLGRVLGAADVVRPDEVAVLVVAEPRRLALRILVLADQPVVVVLPDLRAACPSACASAGGRSRRTRRPPRP